VRELLEIGGGYISNRISYGNPQLKYNSTIPDGDLRKSDLPWIQLPSTNYYIGYQKDLSAFLKIVPGSHLIESYANRARLASYNNETDSLEFSDTFKVDMDTTDQELAGTTACLAVAQIDAPNIEEARYLDALRNLSAAMPYLEQEILDKQAYLDGLKQILKDSGQV